MTTTVKLKAVVPPELEHSRRVAVATPPANPTVEPELQYLLPAGVTLYTTRLPVSASTRLETRNEGYVRNYDDLYGSFGALKPSSLLVGLTGPSYRLGPDGDEDLAARLTAAAGAPVLTVSLAIRKALVALGAQSLNLVSPYPGWLTEKAVAYWEAAGFSVRHVIKDQEDFRAYDLTTEDVVALLERVPFNDADATVMSGTGMITIPAIVAARAEIDRPVLSSNLCGAWWLTGQAGIAASQALRRSCPELADLG
ncbi:maleate cis-trans isomerase family protein [Stappia stellulata]|uniref:maleate cis-trans isomerase family protein n=1 Tax=Stappia stellulata TaxID=71235 RepID=UPI000420C3C3|nr:hypothetical protein [Stappia stellulata]